MKNHSTGNLRICAFGTYEVPYPRNTIILKGLRKTAAVITECHEPIWEGQHDKSTAHRGWALIGLGWRVFRAYVRLLFRYVAMPPHDVVLVGYIGQLDMLLAWFLTRFRRGMLLVFNPNISLYDTFCDDRKIFSPTSFIGRLLWLLDHLSCRLADLVILDTVEHRDYFVRELRVAEEKCCVVPVGSDEHVFFPSPSLTRPVARDVSEERSCEVLFVGKFIPLHGCEVIVEAAHLLRDEPIHFTMVGTGQEFERIKQRVQERSLTRVTLTGWLPYEMLPAYYARADICLGIFGNSSKALRVIPNKVYAGMAMRRAVLTGDTPAVRTALAPGICVWVCRPADPTDLADQLRYLLEHPHVRERVAECGYEVFQQRYTTQAIGEQLRSILKQRTGKS